MSSPPKALAEDKVSLPNSVVPPRAGRMSNGCVVTLILTGGIGVAFLAFGSLMIASLLPGTPALGGVKRLTENLTNSLHFTRPFIFAFFNTMLGFSVTVSVLLVIRQLRMDVAAEERAALPATPIPA